VHEAACTCHGDLVFRDQRVVFEYGLASIAWMSTALLDVDRLDHRVAAGWRFIRVDRRLDELARRFAPA
jgi:hypothetical protein